MNRALRAIVAVAIASGLAACAAGSSAMNASETGADDGREVTVGFTAEPVSLDFTQNDGAAIPQALLVNVYEGLVELDPQGKIVPALATTWTVSPDGRVYTFDLTSDATFASGKQFTADDVVFSIERVKNEWTPAVKSAMAPVSEVAALSPTRVQVTLDRPSNAWLYAMTTRVGAMFSKGEVDALVAATNGTGPYTLAQWNRGESIRLARNPHYTRDAPYFDSAVLRYYDDPTALNNALLTGGIDVISNVAAPESMAQFEQSSDFEVTEGTTTGEVVLALNNREGPFADMRVRQAARAAIDKPMLLDTCWAGKGTLIGSMVPPTDPWYEDLTGIAPYDPERARTLLAEAGQPHPVIRLRLPNRAYGTSCGQVVEHYLEEVGFDVRIDQLEFPAGWLSQVMHGQDYDATIMAHVEPRDLPQVFSPEYYIGYDNPELDRLTTAADTGTPDEAVTNMRAAARLISQEAGSDFLFLLPHLAVSQADIEGVPPNAISESFDLTTLARDRTEP